MVLGEGARLMKGFSQVKQTLPTVTGPPDKKLQGNSKYRKKEFQTFAGHSLRQYGSLKGKGSPADICIMYEWRMRFRKVDSTAQCPTAGKTQWGSDHFWRV